MATDILVAPEVTAFAVPGLPVFEAGDDLAAAIAAAVALREQDVVVVTSKVISRVEGRFVDLGRVVPGARARRLAAKAGKDPRLVELVLRESVAVSRVAPGVIITRHRSGVVGANAGIDQSNARPGGARAGEWVLLLPENPDLSARGIRDALHARTKVEVAVIISDSLGRPFRFGTVGIAIGAAGVPALHDHRGRTDLFGRPLEHTFTALADQIASVADMVSGQSGEGRPVTVVRGLKFPRADTGAGELVRPVAGDLYL